MVSTCAGQMSALSLTFFQVLAGGRVCFICFREVLYCARLAGTDQSMQQNEKFRMATLSFAQNHNLLGTAETKDVKRLPRITVAQHE